MSLAGKTNPRRRQREATFSIVATPSYVSMGGSVSSVTRHNACYRALRRGVRSRCGAVHSNLGRVRPRSWKRTAGRRSSVSDITSTAPPPAEPVAATAVAGGGLLARCCAAERAFAYKRSALWWSPSRPLLLVTALAVQAPGCPRPTWSPPLTSHPVALLGAWD